MCIWNRICAVLTCFWPILERLNDALNRAKTMILLSTPINTLSFKPIRFNNTFWRRLVCVWNRICALVKRLWAIMSSLEGVLEQPKTVILLHISMKNQSFNYTLQQHLLKGPCVHLNPYLLRLEMSLNRLEIRTSLVREREAHFPQDMRSLT